MIGHIREILLYAGPSTQRMAISTAKMAPLVGWKALIYYILYFVKGVNIPVVLLVCEGGPNTLKTAMSAIQRGTPLVVMEGSGRAADFIVKAMKDTRPNSE